MVGTRIDASAALKVPGVKRVFTGDDLVRLAKPIPPPMAGAEGGGASDAVGRQHVALSTGVVRHVGEAVAMEFSPAAELWLTFCDRNQLETVLNPSLTSNGRLLAFQYQVGGPFDQYIGVDDVPPVLTFSKTDYNFGRGQVVTGAATLGGSVAGGLIAQQTNLGIPFVLRGGILIVMFAVAFRLMHDVGFSPEKGGRVLAEIRKITSASIEYGLRVPSVRWLMIESLFTGGVGLYAFYALQPYLLRLYGDRRAYVIAGLAAAIVAGAQILGGVAAPRIRRRFRRRTSALIAAARRTRPIRR